MLRSQLNSKASTDTELIVLVRGMQDGEEEQAELNGLLRAFATGLLNRRLIAKAEFLRTMELGPGGLMNANSDPIRRIAIDPKLLASALHAIVVTKDKITKLTERLSISLQQVKVPLQRGHNVLRRLARSIANKPRRLREALCARENSLRDLLATALDAIVVTDSRHRFVTANSRALNLFGISDRNIRMFTVDAFLRHRQIVEFDEHGPNRKERWGKCEIRRLDGRLLVAEYTFIANVAPRRHLYRFRDRAPQSEIMVVSHGQRHWALNQLPSAASESYLPR